MDLKNQSASIGNEVPFVPAQTLSLPETSVSLDCTQNTASIKTHLVTQQTPILKQTTTIKHKRKRKRRKRKRKSNGIQHNLNQVIIPLPPPPKDEEQISECPDWINKQVCDSFRSCPYFHEGVECDTWVEYGKCPDKEAGNCKMYHHRSIWVQHLLNEFVSNDDETNETQFKSDEKKSNTNEKRIWFPGTKILSKKWTRKDNIEYRRIGRDGAEHKHKAIILNVFENAGDFGVIALENDNGSWCMFKLEEISIRFVPKQSPVFTEHKAHEKALPFRSTTNKSDRKTFKIHVMNPNGDRLRSFHVRNSQNISYLKNKLWKYQGKKLWEDQGKVILTHNNIQLRDDLTFKHYNISKGAKLKIMPPPPTIWITIQTLTHKTITELRDIPLSDTIMDIKKRCWSFPPFTQKLLYDGNELEDDKTLSEEKVQDMSIIYLAAKEWENETTTLTFTSPMGDKEILLHDVYANDTVKDIKSRICKQEWMNVELQRLIYAGNELFDEQILIEAGVEENAKMELVLRSLSITVNCEESMDCYKLDQVKPSQKISDVKLMIEREYKVVFAGQILIYKDQQLSNCDTLAEISYEYRLKRDITFSMLWRALTVEIVIENQRPSKAIKLRVWPTITMKDIKKMIERQQGIDCDRQNLHLYGQKVADDQCLVDIGWSGSYSFWNSKIYLRFNSIDDLWYNKHILLVNRDNYRINTNELYRDMMTKWDKTHYNATLLNVYSIKKNYKQNMNIYDALMNTMKGNKWKWEMLFHGTSFENVKKIIDVGFNRDYNITSYYGKGSYFSNVAEIASRYCKANEENGDVFVMLGCKVYIGESTIGRRNMDKKELYKDDKVTQYDSLVNDLDDPTIFVINRDYHAVPCFIIEFKR